MLYIQGHTIGVEQFMATNQEGETVKMAISNYGYLLREKFSAAFKQFTFEQFADAIEKRCDTSTPQTAEVVRVLRSVHSRN